MTYCTGDHCDRKWDCARFCGNDLSGKLLEVEGFYYFGSGGSNIPDKWICGEYGNWGMFVESTCNDFR